MKVLAIDANSILNRAFYGIKLLTAKDGSYTNGVFGFLNILLKMTEELNPDIIVFAFDLRAPTFRHEMFADYKGKRSPMPQELALQFPIVKEIIQLMGYPILSVEGYEADDIIGTLGRMCRESGNQCVIATGDRDSFQLAHDGVSVRLATTKIGKSEVEIVDEAFIQEKYGVTPVQLIEVKALMGDSSDNIPGVAGVGEKTALDLISKFASLDGVYANIEDPQIKKGVRQKLIDHKDMAYMSRKLAEINTEVPINRTLDSLKPVERQKGALYARLASLELRAIIKRMGLTEDSTTTPKETQAQELAAEGVLVPTDSENIEKILSCPRVYISTAWKGRALTEYAIAGFVEDKLLVALVPASYEGFGSVISTLLASDTPLVCTGSKELYFYGFTNNIAVSGIELDPAISGYIVNPLWTDYSAEKLCFYYTISYPKVSESALVNDVCSYPQLEKKLREEIERNEQTHLLEEIELPLAKVLASMEFLGFELDKSGIEEFGAELDIEIAELEQRIFLYAGEEFNIGSPKQLSVILFEKLALPTRRKTKSGYSTDADVLDSLKKHHPIIVHILEYRKLTKLRSTYVTGLLQVLGEDGRVHTSFRQTETRTGRISSTEPNMQNIPIRSDKGSRLRGFFVAQKDKQLVDADYSQIELRVLAHIAQDKQMIEAFAQNMDIHAKTASEVFDLPEEFITPMMRSRAKAVNFGIVYGIGAFSLSQDIGVSVSEADHYIKSYLQTYQGVRAYMEDTIAFAKKNGYVKTIFGRRRLIPEVSATNKITAALGERVAMNTPIQGSAADIIKIAMIRVYNRLEKEKLVARLILQVHDELIIECPENEVDTVKKLVTEEMALAATLSVALVCEAHSGTTWLDAK